MSYRFSQISTKRQIQGSTVHSGACAEEFQVFYSVMCQQTLSPFPYNPFTFCKKDNSVGEMFILRNLKSPAVFAGFFIKLRSKYMCSA